MAIEDKYKPFWEEKDNSQSSPEAKASSEISDDSSGRDTIKIDASREETESFMEYLAREKNRKPRQKIEVVDIREEDRPTTNITGETIATIVAVLIGVGAVLGVGYLLFNTIQASQLSQFNTTAWEDNSTTTISGVTNNTFLLASPTIMIIFVAIALMIITRRRSFVPFIITFMMSMMALIFFDAPIIVLTIPGIVLFWKMRGWSSMA